MGKPGGASCCITGCTNYSEKTKRQEIPISYMGFPKNGVSKEQDEWRKKLIIAVARSDDRFNANLQKICSIHFEKRYLDFHGKGYKLARFAMPTLNMPKRSVEKTERVAHKTPIMSKLLTPGKQYCILCGAKPGQVVNGHKVRLFCFPLGRDDDQQLRLRAWISKVQEVRGDNYPVTRNSRLCSRHFISCDPHSRKSVPDYIVSGPIPCQTRRGHSYLYTHGKRKLEDSGKPTCNCNTLADIRNTLVDVRSRKEVQENHTKPWLDDEKAFILNYVQHYRWENVDWDVFAVISCARFEIHRTANDCSDAYLRFTSEPFKKSTLSQTDISLGPRDEIAWTVIKSEQVRTDMETHSETSNTSCAQQRPLQVSTVFSLTSDAGIMTASGTSADVHRSKNNEDYTMRTIESEEGNSDCENNNEDFSMGVETIKRDSSDSYGVQNDNRKVQIRKRVRVRVA